ncbi:hypothetical protein SESBI_43975 [Sesbania bispinosa]|nr:hypothetical protein SESBI_43975 [Sesbania bispinosa]
MVQEQDSMATSAQPEKSPTEVNNKNTDSYVSKATSQVVNVEEDQLHGDWLVVSCSKKSVVSKGKGKIQDQNVGTVTSNSKKSVSGVPSFQQSFKKKRHRIESSSDLFLPNCSQEIPIQPAKEGPKEDLVPNGLVSNFSTEENQISNHGIKTTMKVEIISSNRLRFIDEQENPELKIDPSISHNNMSSFLNHEMQEDMLEHMMNILDQALGTQPPP